MRIPNPLNLFPEYRGANNDLEALRGDKSSEAALNREQVLAIIGHYHKRTLQAFIVACTVITAAIPIIAKQRGTTSSAVASSENDVSVDVPALMTNPVRGHMSVRIPVERKIYALEDTLQSLEKAGFSQAKIDEMKKALTENYDANYKTVRSLMMAGAILTEYIKVNLKINENTSLHFGRLHMNLVEHGKPILFATAQDQSAAEPGYRLLEGRALNSSKEDFAVSALDAAVTTPAGPDAQNKIERHSWHKDHDMPYFDEPTKTLFLSASAEVVHREIDDQLLYAAQQAISQHAEQKGDFATAYLLFVNKPCAFLDGFMVRRMELGHTFASVQALVDFMADQINVYFTNHADELPGGVPLTKVAAERMIYLAAMMIHSDILYKKRESAPALDLLDKVKTLIASPQVIKVSISR